MKYKVIISLQVDFELLTIVTLEKEKEKKADR